MSFARLIQPGEYIPKGYGVAWYVLDSDRTLCLPLGLNKIAGAMRRAWHWLMQGVRPSALDRAYREGQSAGYRIASDRVAIIHAGYRNRADEAIMLAEARLSQLAAENDIGAMMRDAILAHVHRAVQEVVS